MKDYDAWARKMKNNLIMCSVDSSTTTVWTMSGGTAPAAVAGTPEQITWENLVRNALEMRATAMIESTLPDHMIQRTFANTRALWNHLKNTYGVRGPMFVYERLMEAMSYKISDTADPSKVISQLEMIFSQISDEGAALHKSIQVMLLLNSLPSRLDYITSHILATQQTVANLTIEDVRKHIVAIWHNPHAVTNAAKYRQQNQPWPQWKQSAPGSQLSGSGPKLQGQGQQQQNPRQNQSSGSGMSSGSMTQNNGEKKKKRSRSKGKSKGQANKASIKQPAPEYTASSAIACPAIVSDSGSTTMLRIEAAATKGDTQYIS
jgi:hypothetical protein